MACDYETEYRCGDGEHGLLKKILGRLKELAGLASVGGADTVTLTVSDIEIGAVEIKDGDTDARVVVMDTCPVGTENGMVVRNIICGTQPISAVSLPLPTGAATEATLIDWLPQIFFSISDLTSMLNLRLMQGQQTMALSLSVTMASDQPPFPLPTGAATEATLANIAVSVSNLDTALSDVATEATLALLRNDFFSLIRTTCPSGIDSALAVRNIPCGTQAISAVALPLPAGAATEATLAAIDFNTSLYLQNIDFFVTNSLDVPLSTRLSEATFAGLIRTTCPSGADPALAVRNVPCGTQAISAVSLPLPTGAATEVTLSNVNQNVFNATQTLTVIELYTSLIWADTSNYLPAITARLPSIGFDALIQTVCPSGADPALVVRNIPCGTQQVSTKTALTASGPAATAVGVTSASAVAANAARKGLILINTSSSTISLGFGAAAVLNSGITLLPGDSFSMTEYSFYTGVINAIALGVGSNLSIQEFTT